MKKELLVIPISGKAQHGKDTSALMLKEILEKAGKKVLITHYGDYLKFVCKSIYGWDGEKDNKGRTILQYVGTDKARKNNPDIWVNVVVELIKAIGEDYDYVLIPDARFPNEIEGLLNQNMSYLSLRVERLDFNSTLSPEQLKHVSETSLDDYNFDVWLNYNDGLENLRKEINIFIKNQLGVDIL